MTNWKQLAQARSLDIPEEQIDKIAPNLEALESSFRPIAAGLPDDADMALVYLAAPEQL